MGRARAAVLSLLATASIVGGAACAAVWGFQDAVDRVDGSVDASDGASSDAAPADEGDAGGAVTPDAADAGVDASSDGPVDAPNDGPALDGPHDAPQDVVDAAPDGAPCTAACVPAAPAGWEGPLEIYEGMGGPPPPLPPSCTGAYPTVVYDGTGSPVAPAAACSCTCGAPTGTSCDPPVVNYFSDNTCTTTCGTPNQPIPTTCTALGITGCGGTHIRISNPVATGGSCIPDAGATVPPAGWSAAVRLCAAATPPGPSGCDAGSVCAPTSGLPFETATYCVARSGAWPCPAGYPSQRTYYGGAVDTRACAPCTCGAPTGATCSGDVLSLYGATCSGTGTQVTIPQTCTGLGGSKMMGLSAGVAPTGGACAPSDAGATGSFTPTTPTTICCTP